MSADRATIARTGPVGAGRAAHSLRALLPEQDLFRQAAGETVVLPVKLLAALVDRGYGSMLFGVA